KIESRALEYFVDAAMRVSLLEKLREIGIVSLIHSSRQHLFALALHGSENIRELEQTLIQNAEMPYVRGDLFCFEDFAYFLLFGDAGLRAGVVHCGGEEDSQHRLDDFCRNVVEALNAALAGAGRDVLATGVPSGMVWRERVPRVSESFKRFVAREGGTTSANRARGEMEAVRLRAVGLMENVEVRRALRRLFEAQREGGAALPVAGDEREGLLEGLSSKLAEAGLIRREILVSCRQDGRALFRLPSAEAFSLLAASNAVCSECGSTLTDEKAEEIAVPTSLAETLLQGGAWLTAHLRSILLNAGVPEQQIATHAISADGEQQLMAEMAGETFLFLLRDGDWTAAHVRRLFGDYAHADAAHLVIIAAGKIHDEARGRWREYARRVAHAGNEQEIIFVEGLETATAELRAAFARVTERVLAEELWELDQSLGFSAGRMLAARFHLLRQAKLSQPAESHSAGVGELRADSIQEKELSHEGTRMHTNEMEMG
ncbi:MAG: hypothetical protein LC742_01990, partial [Acidobacteria bacterium]|nr:hypothetical protein [Acidobacteriota bacterium]